MTDDTATVTIMRLLLGVVAVLTMPWSTETRTPSESSIKQQIQGHADTWVVIVGTSRFWYNYRYAAKLAASSAYTHTHSHPTYTKTHSHLCQQCL